MKFVTMLIMVALLGAAMRYARPLLMKSAGLPAGTPTSTGLGAVHFSAEESDLMATVFKSAIRLLTGSASRKELAGELTTKLYAGRADAATMSELGIELVQPGSGAPPKPGANPMLPGAVPRVASAPLAANPLAGTAGAPLPPGASAADSSRHALLARLQSKALANPELALAPVVLIGMLLVRGIRRRRSPLDEFILPDMTALMPSDSTPYDMTHAVHALNAEDFELLVALVYQRQGYRVSMPAGLSGGRGGDFMLQRKAERLLVQCKNMRQDHRMPIERVRELHAAVLTAGATRGLFVTSCGFTWDARNFAKGKGLTIINARTLDALITEARESEAEDLLAVSQWAPKFMTKVKLTPPMCPTCEAEMEQINAGGGVAWVCSQRPDCRGRRNARKYHDAPQPTAPAKPARPGKPIDLTKLTKSISFTKLTRSINLTRPTKPAVAAAADVPAVPSAPSKPAKAAATAPARAAAVAVKTAAPSKSDARAAAKSEKQPVAPARLFSAVPSPKNFRFDE